MILAIDQGTTGSTALLVDRNLTVVGKVTVDFPQHFPQPGWVEHDPEEIWFSVRQAVTRLLQQTATAPAAIAAIGITNQRETGLIWERNSGRPLGNAIVWQDRRSAIICQELNDRGLESLFREKTGLVFDPYFAGTKLTWRLRQEGGLRTRAKSGELAFGTIDSFLVWRLTGGRVHVTDVSNASRTLLMDINSLAWDAQLADHLEVPLELLPEIRSCSETYGTTAGLDFLPDGIPVAGMAGDQQAALFGQACFGTGEGKCTYGTGAFILVNTGEKPIPSQSGLLTTIAWQIGSEVRYALEGSAFIAGAAVQWLRDGLGLIHQAGEIEALAASVPDSGGLGAPHWLSDARGLISGITRGTSKAHLARATLEGIALQIYELATAMSHDLGRPLGDFKVDGGAAANNLLMQIQADLLQVPVIRPQTVETTALGAAMLAGLAVGVWSDQSEVRNSWRQERKFLPNAAGNWHTELLQRWQREVTKA